MYRASLVTTPQRPIGSHELDATAHIISDSLHTSIAHLERAHVPRSRQGKKRVPAALKPPPDAEAAARLLGELGGAVEELEAAIANLHGPPLAPGRARLAAAFDEDDGEDGAEEAEALARRKPDTRQSLPELTGASARPGPTPLSASASAPVFDSSPPVWQGRRSDGAYDRERRSLKSPAEPLPPASPGGRRAGGAGEAGRGVTQEEGRRLEAWVEAGAVTALGTSLAAEGLDRASLRAIGVSDGAADRLYRVVYLYVAGVHSMLTAVLAGAAPEEARLSALLRAWALLVHLAEHNLKCRLGAQFTKVVQGATEALRRMHAAYDGGVELVKGAQGRLAARVCSLEAALERQQRTAQFEAMGQAAVIERLSGHADAQTREMLAAREMENRYLATVRQQYQEEVDRRLAADARAADAERATALAEAALAAAKKRIDSVEREKFAEVRRAERAAEDAAASKQKLLEVTAQLEAVRRAEARARHAAESADKRVADAVAVVNGELAAARGELQASRGEAAAAQRRARELEAMEEEVARSRHKLDEYVRAHSDLRGVIGEWEEKCAKLEREVAEAHEARHAAVEVHRGESREARSMSERATGRALQLAEKLAGAEERERGLQRERAELQREVEALTAERELAAQALQAQAVTLATTSGQLEEERTAHGETQRALREAAERLARTEEQLREAERALSLERIERVKTTAATEQQVEGLQAELQQARELAEGERRARSAAEERLGLVAQTLGSQKGEQENLAAKLEAANARADLATRNADMQRRQLVEQLQAIALEKSTMESRISELEQQLRDERMKTQVAERVATESVRLMEQAKAELDELKGGGGGGPRSRRASLAPAVPPVVAAAGGEEVVDIGPVGPAPSSRSRAESSRGAPG